MGSFVAVFYGAMHGSVNSGRPDPARNNTRAQRAGMSSSVMLSVAGAAPLPITPTQIL